MLLGTWNRSYRAVMRSTGALYREYQLSARISYPKSRSMFSESAQPRSALKSGFNYTLRQNSLKKVRVFRDSMFSCEHSLQNQHTLLRSFKLFGHYPFVHVFANLFRWPPLNESSLLANNADGLVWGMVLMPPVCQGETAQGLLCPSYSEMN